jgi:hypothetical protein
MADTPDPDDPSEALSTLHRLEDQDAPATPDEIVAMMKLLASALSCAPPTRPGLDLYVREIKTWPARAMIDAINQTIKFRTEATFPLVGELRQLIRKHLLAMELREMRQRNPDD